MYPIYPRRFRRPKARRHQPLHLRFAPGQLPPVNAFWSLTMMSCHRACCGHPINRYLINSPMLPHLKRDAGGGLTLIYPNESPARTRANWLPHRKALRDVYAPLLAERSSDGWQVEIAAADAGLVEKLGLRDGHATRGVLTTRLEVNRGYHRGPLSDPSMACVQQAQARAIALALRHDRGADRDIPSGRCSSRC